MIRLCSLHLDPSDIVVLKTKFPVNAAIDGEIFESAVNGATGIWLTTTHAWVAAEHCVKSLSRHDSGNNSSSRSETDNSSDSSRLLIMRIHLTAIAGLRRTETRLKTQSSLCLLLKEGMRNVPYDWWEVRRGRESFRFQNDMSLLFSRMNQTRFFFSHFFFHRR